MTAIVPSGATTGPVVVTAPGGALTSNVSFRIINCEGFRAGAKAQVQFSTT
jgi:hypothetical protein